jgi:hypothetical protein
VWLDKSCPKGAFPDPGLGVRKAWFGTPNRVGCLQCRHCRRIPRFGVCCRAPNPPFPVPFRMAFPDPSGHAPGGPVRRVSSNPSKHAYPWNPPTPGNGGFQGSRLGRSGGCSGMPVWHPSGHPIRTPSGWHPGCHPGGCRNGDLEGCRIGTPEPPSGPIRDTLSGHPPDRVSWDPRIPYPDTLRTGYPGIPGTPVWRVPGPSKPGYPRIPGTPVWRVPGPSKPGYPGT